MSLFDRHNARPTVITNTITAEQPPNGEVAAAEASEAAVDQFATLKTSVHERLIKEIDLARVTDQNAEQLRPQIEDAIGQLLDAEDTPLGRQERLRLMGEIADEVVGLGPLQPLIDDPSISEIMVNGYNKVYFERKGVIYLSNVKFRDNTHVSRIIDRIISPLGRRLDESQPMVDARLTDGSRVNAIIPPIAIDGPSITIRKFAREPFTVDDLISFSTLTPEIAILLEGCVKARLNTVISGGTGTGKTTLLNVLSSFIPPRERIVTIEDPCELQLRQPHTLRLETRPANIEGKGEITQRQLVRNALRMRPDRIIVGEVRTGEAFDMLQAMNTGHDGSLTTVHANTPRDALARIENMVLMAGLDLPIRAIREQVSSAINLIVHISRLQDGSRRVTQVTEIIGMEGDIITLQDIYVFRQTGISADGVVLGKMQATGLRPRFADRLIQYGIQLPPELFALRKEANR